MHLRLLTLALSLCTLSVLAWPPPAAPPPPPPPRPPAPPPPPPPAPPIPPAPPHPPPPTPPPPPPPPPPDQHHGNLFHFQPGLGACGHQNNNQDWVASVSAKVFNSFPGATQNPNDNPICQHQVVIQSKDHSVTVPIVDFFTDPQENNIGLSNPAFQSFADLQQGIVKDVVWGIIPNANDNHQ